MHNERGTTGHEKEQIAFMVDNLLARVGSETKHRMDSLDNEPNGNRSVVFLVCGSYVFVRV